MTIGDNWKLVNLQGSLEILHIKCFPEDFHWADGVLNPSDCADCEGDEELYSQLWICYGCKEKAPEHLILQWKLLYGK